jgi:phospholipid transport system substrate-binding protein
MFKKTLKSTVAAIALLTARQAHAAPRQGSPADAGTSLNERRTTMEGGASCRDWNSSPLRTRRGNVAIRSFPATFNQAIDQPIVPKMPLCKAVAFAAGLGLSVLSYPVHAAPASGGDTVRGLYEALLDTMKNGRTLGQSGRFTQLAPVICRSFDIASMARLSVGPSWAGLTEAQRQQVTESFGRYVSATYADRFDSYAGQKLEVTGEQPAPAGVMVKSQIIKANGEPVKVDYMMRRDGDRWLISDIYLDGAISEVATRRSEFAAILKKDGIDGLVAALNRKADMLTATTARSF